MKTKLSLLFAILFTGCAAYLGFALFEYYEEEVDLGWSSAAKRNPFLAMQMYLQTSTNSARLVVTDKSDALASLEDFSHLVLTDAGLIARSSQVNNILDWVKRGGHLVLGVRQDDNPLLNLLDIEKRSFDYEYQEDEVAIQGDPDWVDPDAPEWLQELQRTQRTLEKLNCEGDDCEPIDEPKKASDLLRELNRSLEQDNSLVSNEEAGDVQKDDTKEEKPLEQIPRRRITSLVFEGMSDSVDIAFPPFNYLGHPYLDAQAEEAAYTYEPLYWAGLEGRTHFLQFEIDNGMISVLSTADIWNSHYISRLDHAYLLRVLGIEGGDTLVFYGLKMPGILSLFWAYFAELIIATFVFAGLWFWYKAWRIGNIQKVNIFVRRSILESIQSLTGYRIQYQDYDGLLLPLREHVQALANKHIHGFTNSAEAQQWQLLHQFTGLDFEHIKQAFSRKPVKKEDDFFRFVKTLKTLQDKL